MSQQEEYKTINEVKGPLVYVEKTRDIAYGDIVEIETPDGEVKRGEVLETSKDVVVVQVYEETQGIGKDAHVKFLDQEIQSTTAQRSSLKKKEISKERPSTLTQESFLRTSSKPESQLSI